MSCEHSLLSFASSAHATEIGYRRPTAQQRAAARAIVTQRLPKVNPNGKKRDASDDQDESETFPAPLVLPSDDLSLDPRYPPQSLRAWLRLKDRNEVMPEKNVIYVAAPPGVESDVEFIPTWSHPQQGDGGQIATPRVEDVVDYLSAFYHGLPVKLLPPPKLYFTNWDSGVSRGSKSKAKPAASRYIGLNTSTECVRIRTRPSVDGVFARQLNLDDLLDAAISILPKDAYALLLLVDHDLFESKDDEFVCGRAYGGSRVAVISTARYHPALDLKQSVERQHAWPASHCEAYVQACCAAASETNTRRPKKKAKTQRADSDEASLHASSFSTLGTSSTDGAALPPMQAAVSAHRALPSLESSPSPAMLSGLWLGRVCRTASHELGHCFGMDHCVYHACAMQGSSSLTEDARQPPYLCPADLAKMLRATGTTAEQRYLALLSFCDKHEKTHLFAAFAAWIRARLAPTLSAST